MSEYKSINKNNIAAMKKVITPELQTIQKRFFSALDVLIDTGQVNGLKGFCEEAGLNRVKYSNIRSDIGKPVEERKETNYKVIDIEALAYICKAFRVSPGWLLLGRGKMFVKCSSKEV